MKLEGKHTLTLRAALN